METVLIGFSKIACTDWYVTAVAIRYLAQRIGDTKWALPHPYVLLTPSVSIKLSSALDILENVNYNMTYTAKAKSQQFTRRKSSLVKRADQLVRLCNIDLALIICKNGKYYTYRSTDQEFWPPTITNIVGTCGANNE